MKIPASLLSVLLIGLSVNALADKVYRWVDENGQTHFSSMPPEGAGNKAEEYKLHMTRPAEGVEGYRINTDKPAPEQAEQPVTATTRMSKEEADAGCTQAKDYKEKLMSNFSRRFKQEDGEYRPFTDEQRAAEIKKADELIAHYCNQPGKK